jgi:hypothetical protein
MRQIQEELGEADDNAEVDELRTKVDNAKMPDEVRAVCKKQLSRMAGMATASPEFSIARTYVETLLDIPFGKYTDDRLDVPAARAILEAEHAGLDKMKKRILEFLAVRKLAPGKQGPILLFVGPPGVGKTSLGRSIAQSLGRKYVRISLGGVRDEAEVRGHRRTYIGALPGRIINGLKKAGSMNPVFVLDEIDKMTADMRGDPAAAMLEVLDPEQNKDFTDHYVEVPVDLSKVMFICTANSLDTIPGPLLDRMELIELPGYTAVEKLAIATRHLLPKQLAEHGIEKDKLELRPTRPCARSSTAGPARPGVRNLEREIAGLCRSAAVKIAEGGEAEVEMQLAPATLPELLGPAKFSHDQAERKPEVGVITGLAWTPVGGDVMFIETRKYQGKGELRLTGQLGDVMKESATAAHSWVRSNAAKLGIEHEHIAATDLHVHLPQGAVKKDGPSAGVALTCALVSVLSGRPIRNDIAITGEVDLRGNALPVGGIKEKLLAAHRAGIKIAFIPAKNAKDLIDIPPRGAVGARHPAHDQGRRGPGRRPRAGSAQARGPAGDAAAGEPRGQAGGGYAELRLSPACQSETPSGRLGERGVVCRGGDQTSPSPGSRPRRASPPRRLPPVGWRPSGAPRGAARRGGDLGRDDRRRGAEAEDGGGGRDRGRDRGRGGVRDRARPETAAEAVDGTGDLGRGGPGGVSRCCRPSRRRRRRHSRRRRSRSCTRRRQRTGAGSRRRRSRRHTSSRRRRSGCSRRRGTPSRTRRRRDRSRWRRRAARPRRPPRRQPRPCRHRRRRRGPPRDHRRPPSLVRQGPQGARRPRRPRSPGTAQDKPGTSSGVSFARTAEV